MSPRAGVLLLALLASTGCTAMQTGLALERPSRPTKHPTLRWEAFPSPQQLAADTQGLLAEATNVSYELRIRGDDGRVVYQLLGLTEPEHTVNSTLEPGRTYYWTVRPHFRIRGQHRIGDWSTQYTKGLGCLDVEARVFESVPTQLPNLASFRIAGEPTGR